MDPVSRVVLGLFLFAATHIGLGLPRVRSALVARLGPRGFTGLFVGVAWVTFGAAVYGYAARAAEGPAGLALGTQGIARAALVAAIGLGFALMTGAFAGYAGSPYALAAEEVREPRGLERVTRHPFFVGVVLLGGAHALLAPHLVGAVAMGGLALFAAVGTWFQDRKLRGLRGPDFAAYLAATSTVPFAAILAGRQRLVWAELPYPRLLLGVALAWGLRAVHAHLFQHGGMYVIGALVVGPLSILASQSRRERRARGGSAAPRSAAA